MPCCWLKFWSCWRSASRTEGKGPSVKLDMGLHTGCFCLCVTEWTVILQYSLVFYHLSSILKENNVWLEQKLYTLKVYLVMWDSTTMYNKVTVVIKVWTNGISFPNSSPSFAIHASLSSLYRFFLFQSGQLSRVTQSVTSSVRFWLSMVYWRSIQSALSSTVPCS